MQRGAVLVLAVAASAVAARGDDAPARPAWLDEKTWAAVKDEWTARWEPLAEKARLANASSTLVELEQRRKRLGSLVEVGAPLEPVFEASELTALHAVAIANQTAPRLSGHVIRVGGENEPPNLRAVIPSILPGDTVALGPGSGILDLALRAPRRVPVAATVSDLAIVGSGARTTTILLLSRHTQPIRRLRIERCTVDFMTRPFEVTGSWIHLRGCTLTARGGHVGPLFHGEDAVILLEDCTIEGKGRVGTGAFDLGGASVVLCRRTHFANLERLAKTLKFPCAFEDCTARGWLENDATGAAFAKKSGELFQDSGVAQTTFERATDDLDVIACAAGEKPAPDDACARLVGVLDLARSVPYWIGLAGDARPRIRSVAAAQLEKLAGVKIASARGSEAELDVAVSDLDATSWERREEATRVLEAAGELARPKLERAARDGAPEQKARARDVLEALRDRPFVGFEVERARLLRWFERERERLAWSASERRWVTQTRPEGAPR